MLKQLATLSILLILSGCAGKFEYKQPQAAKSVKNTITIKKSKDEVWKKIIPQLGSSFFVINNIDKDSGFINISYSGEPEKYIDCGTISSFVQNARGKRNYNFQASSKYQEYETMTNGIYARYQRSMNLDGRINVVIQSIDKNDTLVSVNAKYIVTKNIAVINTSNITQRRSDTISFNTNSSNRFPKSGTTCYSTGKLEKEILKLLDFN